MFNTVRQQIQPPGSGLSPSTVPNRVDPRFITRHNTTTITEKLDTSVKDGAVYFSSAYYIMSISEGECNLKTLRHRVSARSFSIRPYEVYWKLWNDVLRWSTKQSYRLPMEAELDIAARGGVSGQEHLFSGSNKEIDVAWYQDNTLNRPYAQPVGLLCANELGIDDWYAEDYYYSSPVDNPLEPGSGKYQLIWGSSFRSLPKEDFFIKQGKRIRKKQTWLAVEVRERLKPYQIRSWVGFRPVQMAIFHPVEYIKLPLPSNSSNKSNQFSRSRSQILNKNSGGSKSNIQDIPGIFHRFKIGRRSPILSHRLNNKIGKLKIHHHTFIHWTPIISHKAKLTVKAGNRYS